MEYQKRRKRSPYRLLIVLLIFGAMAFFGFKAYLGYLSSPVNPKGDTKAFVVKRGESILDVADKLETEGLIRSAWVFKYLYKSSGIKIEAGDYKLSSAMSTEEVMKNLQNGSVDKWVTLLEGWRDEEMAEKLNKALGLSKEEFLKHAKQGYMFPDTYLFNPKVTASDVVLVLKNTFNQRYTDELQSKVISKGLTPDQGVILASIVEREARSDEVRTKIAGILLKRLKINMALNADATVQYALGYQPSEKGWWKRHLTLSDLKVNSKYNTYIHPGLPPTPICNPSLSSLKAVANADYTTPFLYYYHDSQGNSYYARTLEEHNENAANNP